MTTSRIADIRTRLEAGDTSASQIVSDTYKRIEEKNEELNAIILRMEERAQAQAEAIDTLCIEKKTLPPLAGVPIALKDNICVDGVRTTAGSRILEHFVSPYNAEVVTRLSDAGALLVGKTNLDEFAMGSSTEISLFGPTKNPHDSSRVAGGSSGGSAAAVAGGIVPCALGTDTGGSIRQPAGFCGIVGFKPTYGRISRYGLVAYGSSLDQAGPLTETVEDAARVYEVLAGPDAKDSTTLPTPPPPVLPTLRDGVKGLRVGLPKEFRLPGVDPRIYDAVQKAADALADAGADVREVSLPLTDVALATYIILSRAEASANLARYDGIRYGRRAHAKTLDDVYVRSRSEGFGIEVKRRILLGAFVLSSGYADQYYRKAVSARAKLLAEYAKTFEEIDVLLGPSTPEVAFRLGEKINDPARMYAGDVFSVPANVVGVPALVLRGGTVDNLPVGVQITAGQLREDLCFRTGFALEQALLS